MKIKRINLHNVGPFAGDNVFEIDCSNNNKNMILIGGKNGAGKTTFFTSLRTCLYGYKAFGYESNNQYYFDEIYKLINDNEKSKQYGYAKIELVLLFNDGMDNNLYNIVREWKFNNKKIIEEYSIFLNGREITDDELIDFENYLMHIIPPNLFKFYFFDGEKIGEFFLQSNQDNSFKNAFLTMTGYDNIELLVKNFKRNVATKSKDSSSANKYFEIQKKLLDTENELIVNNNDTQKSKDSLLEINDEIAKVEKEYFNNGGLTIDEWQSINKDILQEENKREEFHKARKELANSEIPYVIISDKLVKLKKQIEIEEKVAQKIAINNIINENSLMQIIKPMNISKSVTDNIINSIRQYIDSQTISAKNEYVLLGLSSQEKNEILMQIEKHAQFDVNSIYKLTGNIKISLLKSQRQRKLLEKSNIDKYQEYVEEKMKLYNQKSQIENQIKDLEFAHYRITTELDELRNEYIKIKKLYEEELKISSVNDISSRALLTLTGVSENLLRSQINKVENNFKKIFSKLINKADFIDGIYIDEKLNIYPYKNTRYKKSLLKKVLDIENIEKYVGIRGKQLIETHINDENDYIDIPVEISSPFSQGEKQVYIMAIYFALMEISRVEVPFVIDTPFARIDTEHRKNIVNDFFTKLNGQVFILSTDEEITSKYMNKINKRISNQYLLQYEIRGKTNVLQGQYFGGKK